MSTAAAEERPTGAITVIAGGESHGMIDACDCELEPGGGVAKRASLIGSLRKKAGELLLLDAGGFSAGGIYDDYTEGRSADSLRTVAMITAMGKMRYDAVAIGDDDLQFSGKWLIDRAKNEALPLVCANCFTGNGSPLVKPYLIVKKKNVRIAVTAVVTSEKLFPVDQTITIRKPQTALAAIWEEMSAKSDIQVLLSHLGQEETASLVPNLPGIDLVVNGHRKTGKQPMFKAGTVPVLQFGFQGKSLSGLVLLLNDGNVSPGQARWYDVIPELPDHPEFTGIIQQERTDAVAENTWDLYIMSQCPYGMEALSVFLAFSGADTSIVWRIWFIGTVTDDTVFSSLHGNPEVIDEMRWLAVKALYPDRWIRFLHSRVIDDRSTATLFRELGIDTKKIASWVNKHGKTELKKQYDRSSRLSINASPTLMVNNRPFGRSIIEGNLWRFQCTSTGNATPACASLPECVEDTDCRTPGKLSTCEQGKCKRRDAVPFIFTVVVAKSTFTHPENKVIATTRELFPGADIQTFTTPSPQGKKFIEKYRVKKLPFYLFGREVSLAHNFSTIEKGLVDLDEVYTFQDGIVPANYSLDRTKSPGKTVLYIDPFFQGLPDIMELFDADSSLRTACGIKPVILQHPGEVRRGTEEHFRQEEALRWMALGTVSARAKLKYLSAYAKTPGSSYWNVPLAATGVSTDSLRKAVAQSAGALPALWKDMNALSIRDPVVLLIDNVETVILGGERELRRALGRR
ncbi:MAG: hypothetical protein JW863_23950 [Chitinispirillaceae bacterium]|nr:hypothetical protein [Chitinispirillaceae bacterium]